MKIRCLTLTMAWALALCSPALAQDSDSDLAKKTQNPIADLISLPLQNNFDFGLGPNDDTGWTMNIQPVVPIGISDGWNVITRTILPIRYVPSLAPGVASEFGTGDLDFTAFVSPTDGFSFDGPEALFGGEKASVTWGAGPAFLFDTASDDLLGTGKHSVGPSVVALVLGGPWVAGGLVKHFWSFAGDGDRSDVNLTIIQPFINYNFDHGWYAVTAPILTANWELDDDRWLVPLGGGIGRVFRIGKLPINTSLQAYWNAATPDGPSADWQLRFQVQFLFPKPSS